MGDISEIAHSGRDDDDKMMRRVLLAQHFLKRLVDSRILIESEDMAMTEFPSVDCVNRYRKWFPSICSILSQTSAQSTAAILKVSACCIPMGWRAAVNA